MIWFTVASVIVCLIMVATHRPHAYPFLNQFPTLESRYQEPFIVLTLDADARQVLSEAHAHHDPNDIVDFLKGGPNWNPWPPYNRIFISDNLSRFDHSIDLGEVPTYHAGRCVVRYRRSESLLERAWNWGRERVSPDNRTTRFFKMWANHR